jgi:signal transduction histidine kinase
MSHELRTPLNSIIGFTGIMMQGLAGELNEEQQKQMGMIQKSSRHLLALINDVLDISKIEAGQLKLSYENFDLKSSINKVIELTTPLAEKKNLKIETNIAKQVGQITNDQRRIEQILLNLLNNAIKFTDQGTISLQCFKDGDSLEIEVSDTGIGMSADSLKELFLPFHQIDNKLSRKHEGTGLGLSICKRLLDLMGGSISAESEPGKGSKFTAIFPIKAEKNNE